MKILCLCFSVVLFALTICGIVCRMKKNKDGKKHILPPAEAFWIILVLSALYSVGSFILIIVNEYCNAEFLLVHVFFLMLLGLPLLALSNCDCTFDNAGCIYTTMFGRKREYSYSDLVGFSVGISNSSYAFTTNDGKTMHFDSGSDGFFDFLHLVQRKNRGFLYFEKDPYDEDKKHFPDPYKGNVRHGWFFFLLYFLLTVISVFGTVFFIRELTGLPNESDQFLTVETTVADLTRNRSDWYLTTSGGERYQCPGKAVKYIEADGKTEYELKIYKDVIYGVKNSEGGIAVSVSDALKGYRSENNVYLVLISLTALGGFACLILSLMGGRHPKKHPFLYSIMFYRDM